MNARRYARTMQEAFGPYTDHRLAPMRDTRRVAPWVHLAYAVACLALAVVLIIRGAHA